MTNDERPFTIFRDVPASGVVYAVQQATASGYSRGDTSWCNLGQGQPEVGPLPGAPERIQSIDLEPLDHAYGPSGGIPELRDAVAAHYNRLYRQGQASTYTRRNVLIAGGGRVAITRIFRTLRSLAFGYRFPDYTSYEDSLLAHEHVIRPVAIGDSHNPTQFGPDRLAGAIERDNLEAVLLSNPCNPSGHTIRGDALKSCVSIARNANCALIMDEFYSQFVYEDDGSASSEPVSAARYVEDVERDPVLIADGITKGLRSPGWRVGWVLAPSSWIAPLERVAGTLDGGASRPAQRGALTLLEPERAELETRAIRVRFAEKRAVLLEGLEALGVQVPYPPTGSMYVWGDVSKLRAPWNTDEGFFREALKQRVITVPGRFFVLRAGDAARAPKRPAPYPWVRFSFGPPMDALREGIRRLTGALHEQNATA